MSFWTKSMSSNKEKKRPRASSSSVGDDDSKVLERLSCIEDRIDNGFTKINAEIKSLKSELKGDIKSVRDDLNEATKSLNAV